MAGEGGARAGEDTGGRLRDSGVTGGGTEGAAGAGPERPELRAVAVIQPGVRAEEGAVAVDRAGEAAGVPQRIVPDRES